MYSKKRKDEQQGSKTLVKHAKYSEDNQETFEKFNFSLTNLIKPNFPQWKKISAENLDLDYTVILPSELATNLFDSLENSLEYFTGDLARVKVYGKWHALPRKQVTFGDEGLTYKYSGIVTPAQPWPPELAAVKNFISKITGNNYNFVLVNRYKDGADRASEHKDDERDLDPNIPIASLSLGQEREFYFKHQDTRNRDRKRQIERVSMKLEHGSLLLMNKPTNQFWYHALPPRKGLENPRINLTFRRIIVKEKGK